MKKEQLMAKGLSEEHAQIAIDLCREAFRGFVPKTRFDVVNEKLKAAKALIASSPEHNQYDQKINNKGQIKIALYLDKAVEITVKER